MTPPSRKGLEKIFNELHGECLCMTTPEREIEQFKRRLMAWASPRQLRKEELTEIWNKWRQGFPETGLLFLEEVWSWLSGQREAKGWCSHFRSVANPAVPGGNWDFLPHDSVVTTEWDRCPVKGCGQPRPE